jgi:hypothetical protein
VCRGVLYWIFVNDDFCWDTVGVYFDLIYYGTVGLSEIGCDRIACTDLYCAICRIGGCSYRCVCQTISLTERAICVRRSDEGIVLVGAF